MELTLLQMRYFAEVCRCQNITRAAAALHIAQPTLSAAIHSIEETTGLNLFEHVGRNIRVTHDGKVMYAAISELLDHVARVDESLKDLAHRRNYVRLAVPSQIGVSVLPFLLGPFRRQHPEIELDIVEPPGIEAANMVLSEEVDLAIVHYDREREGLDSRKIFTVPLCLCVRADHPLAGKKEITLAETADDDLITLGRDFIITRRIEEAFAAQHIKPHVIHYSPHLSTIWNIVTHGLANAILSQNANIPDLPLVLIPIRGLHLYFSLITKHGRQIYADQKVLIRSICDNFRHPEKAE